LDLAFNVEKWVCPVCEADKEVFEKEK